LQVASSGLTNNQYWDTIDTVMNDLVILATLLDGPKHGYQLKREAGFILGQGAMHNNLVYPLLRRFTAEGWVSKKTTPGERGQTRLQYAITALGRRELVARLSEFGESDASSFAGFITRVGMFEVLEAPVRVRILKQRERYLQDREEKLAGLRKSMELGIYGGEVVRYLIGQIHSELAWIRRLYRLGAAPEGGHREMEGRKV
jgi:DNA-binding PadR family transcriptional regulator